MSGFVTFLIGLVVGWLACKLLGGNKTVEQTQALPASATPAATPAPAPATPISTAPAPAPVAPVVAAAPAGPTADHAGLAAQLHSAKAEIDSHANEVRRLETELDAARRNLLAARHTASNHGSTIASLRDDVKRLQRDLKAALEAAKA